MRIEVEGNILRIVVAAESNSNTYTRTSDHYYDYEETDRWWEGIGAVINKESGEKFVFTYKSEYRNWKPDLKSSLGFDTEPHPSIPNFILYIDEVANEWVRQMKKTCTEKTILPRTSGPVIDRQKLIDKGLVFDNDGQRHLPL